MKRVTQRRTWAIYALVLLLPLAGCTDSNLSKVSQGLLDVAQAMSALQSTVIEANKQQPQLLTDQNTETILRLCYKVDAAEKEASAITRNLTKLGPADSASVMTILRPVLLAVNDMVANGTLGITDQSTRDKVQAGLAALQTALSGIQLVLASSGGK